MRAGELDRRITIQSPPSGRSVTGAPSGTWSDLATSVPARKRDLGAKEIFEGGRRRALVTTEFKIRFRSDVTHDMRISYGGLFYDIEAIREVGRREGLLLLTAAPHD